MEISSTREKELGDKDCDRAVIVGGVELGDGGGRGYGYKW